MTLTRKNSENRDLHCVMKNGAICMLVYAVGVDIFYSLTIKILFYIYLLCLSLTMKESPFHSQTRQYEPIIDPD